MKTLRSFVTPNSGVSSLPLKAPENGDLPRHRYDEGERGPIMSKLHPHPSFVDT